MPERSRIDVACSATTSRPDSARELIWFAKTSVEAFAFPIRERSSSAIPSAQARKIGFPSVHHRLWTGRCSPDRYPAARQACRMHRVGRAGRWDDGLES
jgi:hypothetical protein